MGRTHSPDDISVPATQTLSSALKRVKSVTMILLVIYDDSRFHNIDTALGHNRRRHATSGVVAEGSYNAGGRINGSQVGTKWMAFIKNGMLDIPGQTGYMSTSVTGAAVGVERLGKCSLRSRSQGRGPGGRVDAR